MPFQSVPSCASVAIEGVIDSQPIVNVLNFWRPAGYVQADIDQLGVDVDGAWSADMLPNLHSTYTYVQCAVRGLELIVDLQNINGAGTGPGGEGGDALPSNCAFVLTEYTGHSGRSARGRLYVPGIPASITATANTVTSVWAVLVRDALRNIQTIAAGHGWQLTIVSRVSLGVKRPVGVNFPVVNIVARNLILDSQRNRLPVGH